MLPAPMNSCSSNLCGVCTAPIPISILISNLNHPSSTSSGHHPQSHCHQLPHNHLLSPKPNSPRISSCNCLADFIVPQPAQLMETGNSRVTGEVRNDSRHSAPWQRQLQPTHWNHWWSGSEVQPDRKLHRHAPAPQKQPTLFSQP
jgi:hypothetical protein